MKTLEYKTGVKRKPKLYTAAYNLLKYPVFKKDEETGVFMPIYEYQCTACGHQLEAFQKMSEAPLTECPNCHKANLQKLVSAAGFQLKGTGWYATDFRDKGKDKSKTSTTTETETKKGTDDKGSSSSTSGDAN